MNGGVIANGTGSGKTLCVLASITKPSLIVVPDTLCIHWRTELEKHTTLLSSSSSSPPSPFANTPTAYCFKNASEVPRAKRTRKRKDNRSVQDIIKFMTDSISPKAIKKTKAAPFPFSSSSSPVTPMVKTSKEDVDQNTAPPPLSSPVFPLVAAPPLITVISRSVMRSKVWKDFALPSYDQIFVDEGHNLHGETTIKAIMDTRVTGARWVISATPYDNFNTTLRLLKMDMLLESIGMAPKSNRDVVPFLTRSVTQELTVLPDNISVVKRTVFCEATTKDFYAIIPEILRLVDLAEVETSGIRRFFRILERVAAGGILNLNLMLELAKRCFPSSRSDNGDCGKAQKSKFIMETKEPVVRPFCAKNEGCSICLDAFIAPLQTSCRHVFCTQCLDAILEIGICVCPMCRHKFGKLPLRVSSPGWETKQEREVRVAQEAQIAKEGNNGEDGKQDKAAAASMNRKGFHDLLQGETQFDSTKHVYLDEKVGAVPLGV